ncbi:MAG: phosphopantetheine-binding protein, partial [Pseudomonadota bacterium]
EDRVTDMILVGGENVYPAEVENAIYAHDGVAEVAVFGVPEPYLGEEVHATIVPRSGAAVTVAEIFDVCRTRLAPFKVPSAVGFAGELPKSPTGKVLKRVLRANATADVTHGQTTSVEAFVDGWLVERLGLAPGTLEPDRPFAEYGLDSALGVALARDLGAALAIDLDPTLVWEYPSLDALAKGVAARQSLGAHARPA